MTKEDRIAICQPVLSLIHNDDIRKFTEQLLEDADDYFFVEPASSSGKYHPEYALGEGGLLRHSISVAFILNEILSTDCYEFTDDEKDLLICAALTHDIKKYGNGQKHTTKDHPKLASDYIIKEQIKSRLIADYESDFVSDAVKSHMGKYGDEKPKTDAQKLLHIADCLASRKWIDIKFDSPEISYKEKEDLNKNVGDYIIPFGIHKGERLSEIDQSYVHFLAEKFQHRNHPVVNKAKKFLKVK